MLEGPIEEHTASVLCAQLLFLESQDAQKDITLYINSPGGLVTAGMAIYDTMQYVRSDIQTIVVGQACSMGSLLASAGAKGKRLMLPHARHMIHQPLGGASGQATDVEIRANELLRWKKELTEIYEKTTGQPLQKLKDDMEGQLTTTRRESERRVAAAVERLLPPPRRRPGGRPRRASRRPRASAPSRRCPRARSPCTGRRRRRRAARAAARPSPS